MERLIALVASLLMRTYSHDVAGVDDERETLDGEDKDKDDVEESGSGEFKEGGLVGDIDDEERDNGLFGKNKLM